MIMYPIEEYFTFSTRVQFVIECICNVCNPNTSTPLQKSRKRRLAERPNDGRKHPISELSPFKPKKPLLLTAMDNDGIERLETIMKPTKKHRGVLLFIYFLTVSLQAVVGMQLYRLAESYNVQVLVCHFTRRRHSVRSIPGRLVV